MFAICVVVLPKLRKIIMAVICCDVVSARFQPFNILQLSGCTMLRTDLRHQSHTSGWTLWRVVFELSLWIVSLNCLLNVKHCCLNAGIFAHLGSQMLPISSPKPYIFLNDIQIYIYIYIYIPMSWKIDVLARWTSRAVLCWLVYPSKCCIMLVQLRFILLYLVILYNVINVFKQCRLSQARFPMALSPEPHFWDSQGLRRRFRLHNYISSRHLPALII